MATPVNPVGDSVRLVDDERLDIPDARALQTLIYEYVADAIGGLVGETSGALTDITFTTGDNSAIGIGECTLCGFRRKSGSSARVHGGIFHFDPASNYQAGNATVDVSAYAGDAASRPYLWFKRVELPADLATRHKYDATSEREETFSLNTRLRTKLSFGATATRTNGPDGLPEATSEWFVFAQVISWNATVPTIAGIHPLDVGVSPASLSNALRFAGYYLASSSHDYGTPASYSVGLAQAITFLAQRVSHILDSANVFTVAGAVTAVGTEEIGDPANRGLKQLDADLTAAEVCITSLGILNAGVCIGAYRVNWTGATYELESSTELDGVTHAFAVSAQGAGYGVTISVTTSDATFNQIAFFAQADDGGASATADNVYPMHALARINGTVTGGGNTTQQYRVSVRQNDGANNVIIGNDFTLAVFGSRTV